MANSQPLFNTMDSSFQSYADEWVDFDAFINFHADDYSQTDLMGNFFPQDNQSLPAECLDLPDMQLCGPAFESPVQTTPTDDSLLDSNPVLSPTQSSQSTLDYRIAEGPSFQNMEFTPLTTFADISNECFSQETSAAIRNLVYSRATADPRSTSMKEKRRDAAIALHLQRLNEAYLHDTGLVADPEPENLSPGSNFYPGSVSPQSLQGSYPGLSGTASTQSPSTPASASSKEEQQASQYPSGGVEMVLDLNMNAATRLPKKQKPRTKAQIESYINVRRNGACEKHRRQHKKCNCLDKLATGVAPKAKVRKPFGLSRTAQGQPVKSVQQGEFVPTVADTSKMFRLPSPLYTGSMLGRTYSSQAASAQSMSSGLSGDTVRPQPNSHVKERLSTRSSPTASSVFSQPERPFAYAGISPVPGNSNLARATPASSVHESGVVPIQQARRQSESVAKERRKRQWESNLLFSLSGSGLRHAVETVPEGKQNLTNAVSPQVLAGVFLSVVASAVLRYLQFAMAVASWLQTYSSVVVATALHGYNIGLTGLNMASAERLVS
ncbi:hypothetical protein VTN96DRAFT_2183 [Rasamsonia emersonii]